MFISTGVDYQLPQKVFRNNHQRT